VIRGYLASLNRPAPRELRPEQQGATMKFFMPKPFVASVSDARKAHECMRRFAKKTIGVEATDRKVYRIEFVRDGIRDELRVGQQDFDSGETVVAILDAPRQYLVCTPNQGGYQGEPIVIRKRQTKSVDEFDE
jgi:hypothetical protein